MKFQAAALFSIVLYSMRIGGIEGNIVVNDAASDLDMVVEIAHKLMGVNQHIINDTIKFTGNSRCSGIFTNGKDAMIHNEFYNYAYESDELRLDDVEKSFPDGGIVLSTGLAKHLDINLRKTQSDYAFGTAGDEYLNAVLADGLKTYDACILEFEFMAPSDVTDLYFEYLFGSDEYNEYVGADYHDVFALVLNGENIAIVPNTTDTYVAINTLNKGESGMETGINGEYFVNNERLRGDREHSAYESFAPNGFTRMLEAKGKVNTGRNKVGFHIADVHDDEMDSWVMITGGSLSFKKYAPPPVTSAPTKSPVVSPTESPSAYEKGDPHFMTWAGERYDFHGVCDLVLVHVATFRKGLGMDIHIRSEKMKFWSYVASAAVRIGQEIFEVIGGGEAKFLTNGVEGKLKSTGESLASNISGFPIHRVRESGKSDKFTINLGNDEKIVISTWHLFVSVSFENARSETFEGSVGLLGSFSGGLKLARDGTTIIKGFNEYGQEWQVCDSEPQLFHSVEGPQYPSKCEIPSSTEMRRRLGESELTLNEAKKACANVNETEMNLCIFDVLVTNDKNTAGAY